MGLMEDYIQSESDLKRAREALSWMRMCLASSILGGICQLIMIYKAVIRDPHWWWMLFLAWICIGLAESFKKQARKIYPEGFFHE